MTTDRIPSLYIHIPLCTRKCDYCDFFSCTSADFPADSSPVTRRISRSLVREIGQRSREFSVSEWNTVYIGGGTPSLLSPEDVSHLCSSFSCNGEVSIEANPESIAEPWLSAASEAGITRLSMGIQSLHDPLLRSIGRTGNAQSSRDALERVAAIWKGELSVDLICGIPGQSASMLLNDIRELAGYPVDHVSLYSLMVEPGTQLSYRLEHTPGFHLPDNEQDLWFSARDALEEAGFMQYEVSNFAKSGAECRHNLVYWHMDPYLGAGPSAVGTMPVGDESVRYTNTRDLSAWLENPAGHQEIEYISRQDTLFEVLLMGFRLNAGISRKRFENRFSADILDVITHTIELWKNKELLVVTEDSIALTRNGLPLLNRFLSDCMGELHNQ